MRLPLASYGIKTAVAALAVIAALSIPAAVLAGPYAFAMVVPAAFVLYFFRDPERRPGSPRPTDLLSPADGKVVGIREGAMPGTGEKATVVDIFLSVFNVHVNRAPLSGDVVDTVYKKGEFLNAVRSSAGDVNESNTIILDIGGGRAVAVKQIAGVIARRIVSGVSAGQRVERGERIGMIKFGSRTQAYVPAELGFEPLVSVGQRVKGGQTIIGSIK